jgi:peptidoglycan LD-endopeptidase CwlK
MRKWSARSLKNLQGIHPDLRRVMDRALQESPLDFTVIEGLRTQERQAQLVAEGASRTMNSRHLTGHAVDLIPIGADGKAAFAWPLYNRLAPAVKAAAAAEGVAIVWGGDWKSFKDGPHFELDRNVYPASAWTTGQKPPAQPVAVDDKGSAAPAIGAGVSGGIAAVLDVAPVASGLLGQLAPTAQLVATLAAVGFVVYILWKRSR